MGKYQIHQKDKSQDALVSWLEARGCRYVHLGQPVDGLCCIPTTRGYVSVPIEFKTGRGALRASQEAFLSRWRAPAYVLRTEPECLAMLTELGYLATEGR